MYYFLLQDRRNAKQTVGKKEPACCFGCEAGCSTSFENISGLLLDCMALLLSHHSENLKSSLTYFIGLSYDQAQSNIHQFSGSHDLILKVKGTGMIANMVRSLLGGFNIRQRVKNFYSNEGIFSHTICSNYIRS
jgi:hypothetical protein